MSITYHERPGVYSDYTASSLSYAGSAKTIALIGRSAATPGLYTVTSRADAASVFGTGSKLGRMAELAYENGAGTVLAYSLPATGTANYETALAAVFAEKLAAYCAVDSDDEEVQTALRDAVATSSRQKGECIAVVGMNAPTKAALLERAAALDSERVLLLGGDGYCTGETATCGGGLLAAALCGILAAQTDPALPLNGAVLKGFSGITARYDDTDVDALVQGGVTPLDVTAGQVTVLRAVTTRQTVGEGRDATYRELNTVLIIDDVIPGIRRALAARFPRAKNNEMTRDAIRSQVIVELENRKEREILDDYGDVSVTADSAEPTTCLVSFRFAVTHGLNRIYLTAHISV